MKIKDIETRAAARKQVLREKTDAEKAASDRACNTICGAYDEVEKVELLGVFDRIEDKAAFMLDLYEKNKALNREMNRIMWQVSS